MSTFAISLQARFRDAILPVEISYHGPAPTEPGLMAAIALSGLEPRQHDLAASPAWVRFDESAHGHDPASLSRDFTHCLACLRPPVA